VSVERVVVAVDECTRDQANWVVSRDKPVTVGSLRLVEDERRPHTLPTPPQPPPAVMVALYINIPSEMPISPPHFYSGVLKERRADLVGSRDDNDKIQQQQLHAEKRRQYVEVKCSKDAACNSRRNVKQTHVDGDAWPPRSSVDG